MIVFIFTNCQGAVLKNLLPSSFEVYVKHNYFYINNTSLEDDICNLLKTCDYFIYQPLYSYPVYNTDNLKTYLKPTCRPISFPYIYNNAFTPLFKSFKRDVVINGEYGKHGIDDVQYYNVEPIIVLKKKGLSLDDILLQYKNNEIDFCYKERFEDSINRLQQKEINTDVTVSQFIIDNHTKHRLFNYNYSHNNYTTCNHPSNILITHYVIQIFHIMGVEPIILTDFNQLIGETTYVSRYDIAYYNYEWAQTETDGFDIRIKQLITEIYNIY